MTVTEVFIHFAHTLSALTGKQPSAITVPKPIFDRLLAEFRPTRRFTSPCSCCGHVMPLPKTLVVNCSMGAIEVNCGS